MRWFFSFLYLTSCESDSVINNLLHTGSVCKSIGQSSRCDALIIALKNKGQTRFRLMVICNNSHFYCTFFFLCQFFSRKIHFVVEITVRTQNNRKAQPLLQLFLFQIKTFSVFKIFFSAFKILLFGLFLPRMHSSKRVL